MKLLSIIIPVYNEKDTVLELIRQVEAVNGIDKEIIIVDDGSKDGSAELLEKLATEKPYLKIMVRKENRGKGASVREGIKASTGDYVIIQDADLEYDPQEYLKLIKALEEGAEIVYGSRFAGNFKDMTNTHYLGNRALTIITNLLYGSKLTDMETCYKLVPGDFIRSLNFKSDRFDFEPEITSKILKSKKKIVEVPISYKGRSWIEGKKITWRDGVHALKTLIKFRLTD